MPRHTLSSKTRALALVPIVGAWLISAQPAGAVTADQQIAAPAPIVAQPPVVLPAPRSAEDGRSSGVSARRALPPTPTSPSFSVTPTNLSVASSSDISSALADAWHGTVDVDGAKRRTAPSTASAALDALPSGTPVVVVAWVAGQEVVADNPTWAQLADGGYLYSGVLRPSAVDTPPPPPAAAQDETGRWLDVNLTQLTVVAYDGQNAIKIVRTSTGRPGWETDQGVFHVQRRVASETMDSGTLALDGRSAHYRLEHVHWTQYFTADGKALHENYWKPRDQIGIPSSHGCIGLAPDDAQLLWDFATVGTPIYVHQ
jgi:lipoprotein-anchoring transpeptidase ErfK/SrfK